LEFERELNFLFPEREGLITQLRYALITRHHVLTFGTWGTAKSKLTKNFFGAIKGAKKFSTQFSKFMNESAILGVPNIKAMYKEGVAKLPTGKGTIFDCNLLELDEFLDAPGALERDLLGILNERFFKRGRQIIECDLHSAVACTNRSPKDEARRYPDLKLEAVFDRFLFQCEVGYLTLAESRRRMYKNFLMGRQPSISINYEDIEYISLVIILTNPFQNDYLIEVYEKLVESFCSGLPDGKVVSDRRKSQLLYLVKAHALIYGRYEICPEDFLAIKWGLCLGSDKEELKRFDDIAKPIIDEAKEKMPQDIDKTEISLLKKLKTQIPVFDNGTPDSELVSLVRKVSELKKEVEDVKPQLDSTNDIKNELLGILDSINEELIQLIQTPSVQQGD